MNRTTSVTLYHRKEAFRESVRLLLALHDLMRDGKEESEEADKVRNDMDNYWPELSDDEVSRINGISADLYTLEPDSPIVHPEDEVPTDTEFWEKLKQARSEEDYVRVLDLLRTYPAQIHAARASFLRGLCYERIGEQETAVRFYDDALKRRPSDDTQASMAIISFHKLGRKDKAIEWAGRLAEHPDQRSPGLLTLLADILREEALRHTAIDKELLRRSAALLQLAIDRLATSDASLQGSTRKLLVNSLIEAANCYWNLDEEQQARQYIDRALDINPDDDAALTLRGLFNYENRPQQSLQDFARAAEQKTPLAIPYVFLAHQAIRESRYADSAALAREALERTDDANEIATLLEWLAISYGELGAPREIVIDTFNRALSVWPGHPRIMFNQNLYIQYSKQRAQLSYQFVGQTVPRRFSFGRPTGLSAAGIGALVQ